MNGKLGRGGRAGAMRRTATVRQAVPVRRAATVRAVVRLLRPAGWGRAAWSRSASSRLAPRWWARAAAALGSLVLLGTGLAGTAQAAYPGSNGLIAFARGGSIFTIEPSGAGLTQLTSGAGHSAPRWSPSGRQIAYLFGGDLWIMAANGTGKTRVTDARGFADSRPSWSPNGRYLAFVKTQRGHKFGLLTRYDTVTHDSVTFSTPFNSEAPTVRQVRVTALPSPVAWGRALNAGGVEFGSFIIFEGAAGQCQSAFKFCLVALGFPHQNRYRNGFPSAEDLHTGPTRLLDPDWFPVDPRFGTDVLTTQEHCARTTCTRSGIDLAIGNTPVIPGAYQAVYSPEGRQIAYVKDLRGRADIFLGLNRAQPGGTLLTVGSQPDWQPLPVPSR